MITLIIILVAISVLGLNGGVVIWFVFRARRLVRGVATDSQSGEAEKLPFRWSYIILPAGILFLAIILAAYFYYQLPAEVAYRFKPDGSPDSWLSREMIMVWMLIPQLCLALLAGAIVCGMTTVSILFQKSADTFKPYRVL